MKNLLYWTLTFGISLVLLATLSEGLMRLMGVQPWRTVERSNEPSMHEPDPVLGWRNKEGTYEFPPYVPSGMTIHATFLGNGGRATSTVEKHPNVEPNKLGALVITGGSYTQGWAISDHETYAWKLQNRYPHLEVINYGTGAYGTYQSLLLMERELPKLKSPKLVLYGFIDHHEIRNVATARWLRKLSRWSRRGHVHVPYATVSENCELVRHPPEDYGRPFPLRDSLAIAEFAERIYKELKIRIAREHQKRQVTECLLLKLNTISQAHGAQFAVAILEAEPETKTHYKDFLKQRQILAIDCAYPRTPETMVLGEGHPNGEMNTRWVECMGKVLDSKVARYQQMGSLDIAP